MKRVLTALFIVALVAGCKSTPKEQEGARVEDRTPTTTAPTTQGPSQPSTSGVTSQPTGGDPLRDPNNILSKRSVYFDYDQFVVKDEFRPIVNAHAKYLSTNSGRRITIQGNTDERGSREYNLALGQKRADAVKQMMVLSGTAAPRIETVSFGEEKPRAQGANEAAFAENRRADIVYDGE
jgi:peptidoglycan-associated lipoprotein